MFKQVKSRFWVGDLVRHVARQMPGDPVGTVVEVRFVESSLGEDPTYMVAFTHQDYAHQILRLAANPFVAAELVPLTKEQLLAEQQPAKTVDTAAT